MKRFTLVIVAMVMAMAGMTIPIAALAVPCAGFTDVEDASGFCTSVAWMKNRGITLGCTSTLYCPDDFVRRDQMAAFLYRLGFQNAFLTGGNAFGATAVLGTTDSHPLDIRANGARVMRYEPHAISPNVIGGSPANGVTAGVRGATIAGGGIPGGDSDPDYFDEAPNRVTDHYGTIGGGYANVAGDNAGMSTSAPFATIAGGWSNSASGAISTVTGGVDNTASSTQSTVAGGGGNTASGHSSTVGGGVANTASGSYGTVTGGLGNDATGFTSTVAGGSNNAASGAYSFAAGVNGLADQSGCFAFVNWSNLQSGSCLGVSNVARFILDHGLSVDYHARRADGGGSRWVYVGDVFGGQTIATWTGAFLSDAGVWTNNSDRARKDGFAPVDARAVLDGVVRMPITRWHYRHDGPGVEHIGPMAQDFRAAFGLGDTDRGIGTVDADGVALAAIQGLNAKLEERETALRAEVKAKDAQIAALVAGLDELRRVVERLRRALPGAPD